MGMIHRKKYRDLRRRQAISKRLHPDQQHLLPIAKNKQDLNMLDIHNLIVKDLEKTLLLQEVLGIHS
jgi:hypothetical protein